MNKISRAYRSAVLKKLAVAIQVNRANLEGMNVQQFTPGIAWTARNILELHAWTGFCIESEDNAKRFFDDSARDAIGSMDIPDELIKPTGVEKFNKVRERMLEQARTDSLDNPTGYMSVGKAAKSIGLKHFAKFNMILSKWTHPTALSIISKPSIGKTLNPKFYEIGIKLAEEAQERIGMFLMT